jgi:hypothetical protein
MKANPSEAPLRTLDVRRFRRDAFGKSKAPRMKSEVILADGRD